MTQPGRRHPLLLSLGIPVAATTAALAIARSLAPYVDSPVFALFVLAVAVSAWLAGSFAGILALILGLIESVYFIYTPLHTSATGPLAVRLSTNCIVAAIIIFILARLRSEQQRSSHLGAILESSADAVIGKSLDGIITSWNRGAERLYGYHAEEAVGRHMSMLVAPGQNDLSELMHGIASGNAISHYETRRRRKDGTVLDVQLTISPIRDRSGKILGASTAARDITALKRAEEDLRASHWRTEALAQVSSDLLRHGAKPHILASIFDRISQRLQLDAFFHYRSEPKGRGLRLEAHGGIEPEAVAELRSLQVGEAICGRVAQQEQRIALHDIQSCTDSAARPIAALGMQSYVCFPLIANGTLIGTLSFGSRLVTQFSDDTVALLGAICDQIAVSIARENAELALRESEEHARRIIDSTLAFVAVITLDGTVITVNSAALLAGGLTLDDVVGRKFWDCYWWSHDPSEVERLRDAIARAANGESVRYDVLARIANDGRMPVDFMLAPMRNAAGEITHLIPSGVDLTQRKQADEALRRSEARLRRFYDSGMVGVIYWNMDGAITDANDKFLEMVGYTHEELAAGLVNWARMTPPEYTHLDDFAISELKTSGIDTPYEKEYIRKDGTRVPIVVGAAMLDDARFEGVAFVLDNTERKRAEQALIRSEKLASVGRMAATVAHEINNPLELITNSVYLASLDTNLSQRARESLNVAEQELERVAHLTRQTLGFYRENTAPANVNAAALVQDVVGLYAPKFNQRDLTLESEHAAKLYVHAIAGEIRQVVSNIVANAIDACERGDRIRVRTSRVRLDGRNFVRLTFADTGEGIAPGNLRHIFEPFFTTKESVGTGLGLWVSCEIVRRHNGKIRVRSRLGQGTVFSILLPENKHPN